MTPERVALVTGGNRGIGHAIALRLRHDGFHVVILDLDNPISPAHDMMHLRTDVTSRDSIENAVRDTIAHYGHVDVLVNNAGIAGRSVPTANLTDGDWLEVLSVNLTGPFHCCRAVVPHMVSRGWGRIINIASIAGKEGNPNAIPYSASKAGLIGLTKALGKELAGTGVLVNCVTPAVIETDLLKQMTAEHVQYMVAKIPMGRMGRPEEVAALVAWLASDDCSFSTGAVFDISGGRATY